MSNIHKIQVPLPNNTYEIHIEAGAINKIPSVLSGLVPGNRIAALCDKLVFELYADAIEAGFSGSNFALDSIDFEASESKKTHATIEKLYSELLDLRYERGDTILAIGGGVAGDLVGFVAATYLRGIPFIQVPTTLLAMVDASVGGKVGYNNSYGKNLIGAFHQPKKVIVDPNTLKTLARDEFISGLAECVKHAVLKDTELFEWTRNNAEKLLALDIATISKLIAKNVEFKAQIVAEDEKESGQRALLNFGHTFGHAIESVAGYGKFLHGQAVSLGMVAASFAAVEANLCEADLLNQLESLLSAVELPIRAEIPDTKSLMEKMKLDKKVNLGKLRLILPRVIGNVEIIDSLSDDIISKAWDYIRKD
ncbi:UNVERIFIED_CONTAM: hypothetical protein GTU68_017532 [Idotea baltica]|nr:hypothetical protein [Idotea baltica]